MTTKVQGDMYDIDGATVATVAAADKINFFDVTDSLVKEDTVQGVLDLVPSAGWTSGTKQDLTSGTTKDFTGLTGATMVLVTIRDMAIASSSGVPIIQLGDAGGFETTGYLGGITEVLAGSHSVDQPTAGLPYMAQIGTASVLHSQILLSLIDNSTNSWGASCSYGSSGSNISAGAGGSSKSLSGALTQIRITTTSAVTFSTGTVNIQWM